ncbi:MAG: polysaccharide biosynthesis protein [Phycisphaerales bacterium]|nr:polysaccharide biosynthesis protein [Phycisphaerales bacterium]
MPTPEHNPASRQPIGAQLFERAANYRNQISITAHVLIFAVSLLSAFGLAYNFHGMQSWFGGLFPRLLLLVLPVKMIVFGAMRQYQGSWRYVSLRDLASIAVASQISSFIVVFAYFVVENISRSLTGKFFFDPQLGLRQSVFLIDWAATIAMVSGMRVLVRSYYEFIRGGHSESATRILIVGAGDAGDNLIREILRRPELGYDVVGLVDDDVSRIGHRIHGTEVIGRTHEITDICERYGVDELLIAMPEAKPRELRSVVDLCKGNNLRFRTIPPMSALITGGVEVSQLRKVDIEDLLGREPVSLDIDAIGAQLCGKRIVVTGAGGSIGSEMCRQIAPFQPDQLILVEQAENALFEIHRELIAAHPTLDIVPIVADICDATRVRDVFDHYRPNTVFHAAAHKHVPMMECNPGEAIKNNIVGTRTVALAADEFNVEKMVMISTDKAVNPTSVMGCSKRVAEIFVQQFGKQSSVQFVTVRFGNVLGSSGSVIPIFRRQIAAGGPVTVTHPEMTRYFMTIPEASQLVLQAGTMGRGGEVYVLEMGEPVKIVDLATNMITLSGLRVGEEIEIVFTGTRPGEKLYEELLIDGENVTATSHPKIGIWESRPEDWDDQRERIDKLIASADSATPDEIRGMLGDIVPEYQPAVASGAPAPATGAQVSAKRA